MEKGAKVLCLFISAGTQVPPQLMEVRSSGLALSRFQPTCMH